MRYLRNFGNYMFIFLWTIPFISGADLTVCKASGQGKNSRYSKVDGTTGTPLGGVGTGAVKYCAWTGILNAFTDMTPAGMQRYNKHVTLGKNACFQFYSKRSGKVETSNPLKVPQISGHYDDDAIFPVHQANFGLINNIRVSMTGFCPWNLQDFDKMCLPYSFFEFTLENTDNSPADAAVAMNIKYETIPVFIPGKGLKDDSGMHQKAVFAKSSDSNCLITAGNDDDFYKNGKCSNVINDTTNRIAVKIQLKPKEKKTIKFVLAWYKVNKYGKYFYENAHSGVGTVTEEGLKYFDGFKTNAITFVDRMRGSTIPQWMTNYLLNVLCNMVNNSVYSKDGRACMAEGEFNHLGTIDEYWQGRNIIGSNMMPYFTWKELEYWGRTQFREPYLGQIHHDFHVAKSGGVGDEELCAWDDYKHMDYRALEDVVSWPDENVGFIVGAYETFIATDNIEKLKLLWPYLKNTGKRLLAQKEKYGDPNNPWTFETSHNMYDAGGYCQTYSTGVAIPAYRCMAKMSRVMGEEDTRLLFENAEKETIKGFEKKYLTTEYIYLDKHCENALSGPWFSQCLKFDQFDNVKVDRYIFDVLDKFYKPTVDSMGYPKGTYNEWPQHIVGHLGGYALQRNKLDIALALWKDMYNRSYTDRNRIFNLPITLQPKAIPNYAATSIDGYYQYTSRTSTWRIYQDMIGYYRNKHTGEIWLEPVILPEMNHELIDGYYISSEGNGTVSCIEKGNAFEDRTILFKPENPIRVNGIYIKDHQGIPVITVNGYKQSWTRTGPEWKRRILINWRGTISVKGIVVEVK
jgi:hypothetical protein